MDPFFVNDCAELAGLLLYLNTEDPDIKEVENKLYDKYNIDFDSFVKLIDDLIKFTPIWRSAFGKQYYQGFVHHQGEGLILSIVKREYKGIV